MQPSRFPAAAANSLIQGYCDDFVSLAAVLAQTLEQVAMRDIDFANSRGALERIENGMRDLGNAIHELLARGRPEADPAAAAKAARRPATPRTAIERLEGSAKTMPLLSVFQFLGRLRKSGVVEVTSNDARVTFRLQNGCIVDSDATPCPLDERLADLLVEQGICATDRVQSLQADGEHRTDDELAGAVVAAGAPAADVVEALTEQAARRYARACRDPKAAYVFRECSQATPAGSLRQPFAIR